MTHGTLRLDRAGATVMVRRCRDGIGPPQILVAGGLSTEVIAVTERWPGPTFLLEPLGHGGSSRVPGGGYSVASVAGDIAAAVQHIPGAAVVAVSHYGYAALLAAGAGLDLRGVYVFEATPASSSMDLAAEEILSERIDPFDAHKLANLALDNGVRVAIMTPAHTPWLVAVSRMPGVDPISIETCHLPVGSQLQKATTTTNSEAEQ